MNVDNDNRYSSSYGVNGGNRFPTALHGSVTSIFVSVLWCDQNCSQEAGENLWKQNFASLIQNDTILFI